MNILLVEDDRQVADFIVSELTAAGHGCVYAGDGEAGMQCALAASFDVMIIDFTTVEAHTGMSSSTVMLNKQSA